MTRKSKPDIVVLNEVTDRIFVKGYSNYMGRVKGAHRN